MLMQCFKGKKVLVTGHTGFKGTWLSIWLQELGAEVIGYSLEPPTNPGIFDVTEMAGRMTHIIGDVRDFDRLSDTIYHWKPEVIFHLAAQPIVLNSYEFPKETFDINVGGTINLLEVARFSEPTKAIVVITTDKVYDNKEWVWGYRENDSLGAHDPYSTSKAMTELATQSYSKSLFKGKAAVATARAGNVIGGGDFSDFRLVPDAMKALMQKKPIEVRNPNSVRPWLHVLDPLQGYLTLASKLLNEGSEFAEAWNFGPKDHEAIKASSLVEKSIELWGDGDWVDTSAPNAPKEMQMLRLNWDKASNLLKWQPNYNWEQALEETVEWFQAFSRWMQNPDSTDMHAVCVKQIQKYMKGNRCYSTPRR